MSKTIQNIRLLLLALPIVLLGAVAQGASEAVAAPAAPCPAGKALYDTGRFGAAEASYAKALEDPKTEGCAKAGLKELDENQNECATATALKEAGREAQSEAAFEKVLEKLPGSKCAKEGVEEPEKSVKEDLEGLAEDALDWVVLIAVGLGLLTLALVLLIAGMTHLPVIRSWWPANRFRTVRVGIDSFEDSSDASQGDALAALVRSKIESFGTRKSSLKMVDSKAAVEETIWTKFGAINDQAKTVSTVIGLIGALFARRQFQATGVIQTDNGAGPGLSLSLRRKQEIVGATTLWAQNFELEAGEGDEAKIDRLQKLGVPAAAWISHTTATAAGKTPGGAKDPVSWAMFKTGTEWERSENTQKAKSLYKAAIDRDPTNWGALAQLGKLESEAHNYNDAIELLNKALDVLEK